MRPNGPWRRSGISSKIRFFDAFSLREPASTSLENAMAKIKPAPEGAGLKFCEAAIASGAGVQHRHRAAVLRPAGDVVTHRYRAFLAVGDRAHPVGIDAARGEIALHRLGAARTERDVV